MRIDTIKENHFFNFFIIILKQNQLNPGP